jgi:integrase
MKLLDQVRAEIRKKHYSIRTEDAYCGWIKQFIRTVQELLGHQDVTITMIYTHVVKKGGMGVKSLLDMLG